MKISVITVCYNSAETIGRMLHSVREQTYSDIEHILIDGRSTDNTLEVVAAEGQHVVILVSEKDKGIYDAMNKGLERATGEIVCFLNADDQYESSHVLSRVAKQMQEHQLDALFGDVTFFHSTDPTRIVRRYRSGRFRPERLAWGWMPAHPALFLNKYVVQRVGQFKANYRIAGDFDYIARTFYGQDLRYQYLPEVLVRMQTGGVSTAGWRSKVLLNQEVLRSCRENGISTNLFRILSKYPMKLLELFGR